MMPCMNAAVIDPPMKETVPQLCDAGFATQRNSKATPRNTSASSMMITGRYIAGMMML